MPLPSIFIITAGPNDLAGLIEAPVNGIPKIVTSVKAPPINNPDSLSNLSSFTTCKYTNTNTKVNTASTRIAPFTSNEIILKELYPVCPTPKVIIDTLGIHLRIPSSNPLARSAPNSCATI